MSLNDTVKSIHRLANVHEKLFVDDRLSIVLTPQERAGPSQSEMADAATSWFAQTYMGKGQWGATVGEGRTPEEALERLLGGLKAAHRAMDERRARALAAADSSSPVGS